MTYSPKQEKKVHGNRRRKEERPKEENKEGAGDRRILLPS
jgi:hypothetical protein